MLLTGGQMAQLSDGVAAAFDDAELRQWSASTSIKTWMSLLAVRT